MLKELLRSQPVLVAALVLFTLGGLHGQEAVGPTFEVASVKIKDPNLVDEVELAVSGSRLVATNLSLQALIAAAYAVDLQSVINGPSWLRAERFNILANAGENFRDDGKRVNAIGQSVPQQIMFMLQALLADRFRLQLHREMKQITTYDLVVAKGGPKLHPSAGDQQAPALRLRQSARGPDVFLLDGKRASMDLLADGLDRFTLHTSITNKTGVQGEYDFQIEYSPGLSTETAPTVFTAIQEQVGLKLEPKKGSAEMLVVDRAEKPSAN
jgi:uncharacterized protein (TIGR03435 family)